MSLPPLEESLVVLGLCTALAFVAWRRKVFTAAGSLAAFAAGMVIGLLGDLLWLLLLVIFLVSSFGATRYKFDWKLAHGLQEGVRGERGVRSVLANGLIPLAVAVLSFAFPEGFPKDQASLAYVAAIGVAAADTAASEIGIVDPRVVLITNFQPVQQGVDGGVSLTGQFVAFVAAAYTSTVGYLLFAGLDPGLLVGPSTLFLPMFAGFIGCQIDSVLGATWERAGRISKLTNNIISITAGSALAYGIGVGL